MRYYGMLLALLLVGCAPIWAAPPGKTQSAIDRDWDECETAAYAAQRAAVVTFDLGAMIAAKNGTFTSCLIQKGYRQK